MTSKQIGIAVNFVAACVVEPDYIYIAEQLDDLDPREYVHTRMGVYVGRFEPDKRWYYHDVKALTAAVTVKKATATEGRRLVALSNEGEVEIYSNKDGTSTWEKIPDAGLRLGKLGYLRAIREIGDSLFACGYNDQVYQRKDGQWISLTMLPLRHRDVLKEEPGMFESIDGFSEQNVYTVGLRGQVFHWNGAAWRQIEVNTDEGLNCVRCYGTDEVWIAGDNGTLLKGNAMAGFKDVSAYTDNMAIYSLAKFQGQVYLGTREGLHVYDGQSIQEVDSGLDPEIDTYTVDAVEGALWSVGSKDIVTFDGHTWTRIDHPDNAPIRP